MAGECCATPRAVKTRASQLLLKVAVSLLLGGAVCALAFFWHTGETPPEVCASLRRARVSSVLLAGTAQVRCEGISDHDLADSPLRASIAAPHAEAAASAWLREKGVAVGLVAGHEATGVLGQLAALQHVSGFRGVTLAPELAVSVPTRETKLSAKEADAVAYVARALFRGTREPSLSSFPASLRKVDSVEVIVTLSERGRPLLWRSARGTSIARTLLTATRVARDRWHEREQAMGGPLEKRLLSLDVEVGLLVEDGTLASLQQGFVNQAITEQHGIGFDYRSGWHYLSPADVLARGKGSAFSALMALLEDQGLTQSVLKDPNLRVYRFVPVALGVSKAPLGSSTSID